MALTLGTQLGSHELTAFLGKGSMGEVYRARDINLKQEIAIRILKEELARDAGRLNRFQREVAALASLNHPHIARICDLREADGYHYLVLELVEGETLADLIAHGPVPFQETLNIAKGVCGALEAGHRKGIVHRDLKPGSIKIMPDGKVKVLDFGLTKVMGGGHASVETHFGQPSVKIETTRNGMIIGAFLLSCSDFLQAKTERATKDIMGTAAYMSPEQATGGHVDKRADIWAFGAVLFEMLSGRRAFRTATDSAIEVLRSEPEWSVLPNATPPHIRELLGHCLKKDLKRRLCDIGDARRALERVGDGR
jgi:serine/threonine protein kinase